MIRRNWLSIWGPGILVAATGVGAGDLATASFTGGQLGVAILWAVVAGALLKFVLTEGLARWQIATGQTFLQGALTHIGKPFQYFFALYLLYWSLYVGSVLMAACGVATQAIVPAFEDPQQGKFWFGAMHSLAGLALVWWGGFRVFEKVMAVCIGVMFVTVLVTAFRLGIEPQAALHGLFVPTIPHWDSDGLSWTVALMGGVGGTLTILCYGYWMEESPRSEGNALRIMRIDLGLAYGLTALFGIAMVLIGSQALIRDGSGAALIVRLTQTLRESLGPVAGGIFLVGAWGAFFSSLLGVWQSVPYLFADFYYRLRPEGRGSGPLTDTRAYRGYLIALALVPMIVLGGEFKALAKYYSLVGAAFMPFLALALLYLNNQAAMPAGQRNRWPSNGTLAVIIVFFAYAGYQAVAQKFGG